MIKCKLKFKDLLIIVICFITACKKENAEENNAHLLLSKKYDEVCFLMTHNAMNNSEKGYTIPNQTHTITEQLNNGVRGLMIDTYDGSDGIALTYHGSAVLGQQKLVDVLFEINDFLTSNKNEVISIIFQNEGSNIQLEKAIDSAGLTSMAFIHADGAVWPTLQTMVDSNRRLVLFIEFNKNPRTNHLLYAWKTIFDTRYNFNSVSEFDCSINRGNSGNKQLYLINHWLQKEILPGVNVPDKNLAYQANRRNILGQRVQNCSFENNHFINFLGLDFYEIGEAKAIVDSINFSK